MKSETVSTIQVADTSNLRETQHNCLPAGTRLDDYEITGVIGEGGFGIVYLAFDHALHRTVAIKEYMPGALAWRGAGNSVLLRAEHHRKTFKTGLESFINEARLLAQLDHPALIRVYRYWESNNTGYMAMRYYQGQTLQEVIRNDHASITGSWLKSVMSDIMDALEVLHAHQILHRDISPENIIILSSGSPVLLDFGAARRIIGNMSQALTVILKPGYAPIEQYADDTTMRQGPWTDVYALCGVMYAAIQKKPPATSIARMIKDPLVPLSQGGHPGYDASFLLAIDQGLAVRPEERPQSMSELRQLIGQMRDHLSPSNKAQLMAVAVEPVGSAQPIKPADAVSPKKQSKDEKSTQLSETLHQRTSGGMLACFKARVAMRPKSHLLALGLMCVLSFSLFYWLRYPVTGSTNQSMTAASMQNEMQDKSTDETVSSGHAETISIAVQGELTSAMQRKAQTVNEAGAVLLQASPGANAAQPVETGMSVPVTTDSSPPGTVVPGKGAGTLTLLIKPWAMVSIDGGEAKASPPLRQLMLKPGKHIIAITNPNFETKTMEIDVKTAESLTVKHDFYGTLKQGSNR